MRRFIYICIAMLALELAGAIDAGAQYLPERREVRKGNRQFDRQNYKNSIDRYINALDADSTCYEALYNLGNAYYQANLHRDRNPNNSFHWSDADSIFTRIGRDTLMPAERRAEALRNLGESQLTQQRFEEALASFKESLKLNPADRETKYNYILAKRIVDQQKQNQDQNQNGGGNGNDRNQDQNQNGGGGGGNDQDQNNNRDQNNDQNGDQNEDQKNDNNNDDPNGDDRKDDNDQNDRDNDKNNDRNDDNRDDNDQRNGGDDRKDDDRQGEQPQPQKSGMSREEQQRMLEAVQAEEDKTQDKLKEKGTGVMVRGKKNW
ncbi:MAG: tetratricopeptide repeat protein [Alistipes sp.]|nr:tetratricopeptide repeat protein [Alistipes sp.]